MKTEIANARDRAERENKQMLFPITLAPFPTNKQATNNRVTLFRIYNPPRMTWFEAIETKSFQSSSQMCIGMARLS